MLREALGGEPRREESIEGLYKVFELVVWGYQASMASATTPLCNSPPITLLKSVVPLDL